MQSKINPSNLEPKWTQTSDTTWIVELEEDPETGDIIMPIPLEALDAQGWKVGDTLVWDTGPDGELILTKKPA
jgi:hypothetical protein